MWKFYVKIKNILKQTTLIIFEAVFHFLSKIFICIFSINKQKQITKAFRSFNKLYFQNKILKIVIQYFVDRYLKLDYFLKYKILAK